MANRRLVLAGVAGILAVVTALMGIALATPGSGVTATVVARGAFADPTDIKFKVDTQGEEVMHAPDARDTVMQQIIIGPGGHTGWHSHPGPVVVVVTGGTLTFYASEDPACTPRRYDAGQAFIDRGQGHVHIARNESATDNLVLWATYFDVPPPPPTTNFRIDVPAPGNCPF